MPSSKRRAVRATLAMALCCGPLMLAAATARAFDPQAIDILTLRLGMTEAQVTERLASQGYVEAQQRHLMRPCAEHQAIHCLATIAARTKDGLLEIGFTGEIPGTEAVDRIVYTLDGRRPGEPEAIETSVLQRFGPPTNRVPMTWCDRPVASGPCPQDMARLSFVPGHGFERVLSLTAAARPAR
ncbi:MAG: hypothetical protein AB7O80_15045 [Acetobacteraceae bacterium]